MKKCCAGCGKRKEKSLVNPEICVTCFRKYPALRVTI